MITEYLVIEMGVGERIMRILREMEVGEEWPVPVHLHHVLQRPPRSHLIITFTEQILVFKQED